MGEGEADSSVTHAAAARMLGVPSDLLEAAIEAGQVDTLGKQGAYYRMNPAGLPDAAGLVAAARDAYRLRLREVVAAAETLMAEVEAVQLDALEALENDTDPVRPLGPDIDGILTRGRGERGMTGSLDDLRSACLWATGAH